jgi:hypothetical protein
VHSPLSRLRFLALALFFVFPAAGQSRDAAATRTIDLAINAHYLTTDFDTAQKLISATIEGCADQCSPKVLARAYMYLGVVLGAGKSDMAGAKEAFISALAHDPGIKLDRGLATPEVTRVFDDIAGPATGGEKAGPSQPERTPRAPSAEGPAEGASAPGGGGLNCTPQVTEIEIRRPIPVQCRTDQDVTSVHLRYQPVGGKTWTLVAMTKKGNSYRAEIPCKETGITGTVLLYARAEDNSGEDVATWGTKAAPVRIRLVEKSSQEPPRFDDAEPPARCQTREDCPPNFPGCGTKKTGGDVDWGGGCDNSSQCKPGLLCIDGTCDNPPSCNSDGDCPTGRCVQGQCRAEAEAAGGSRPYRKHWFGLHLGQDFAFFGGRDLCTQQNQADGYVACYYAGSDSAPFINEPYRGVDVGTGLVLATTRILLAYEYAFTSNITAGIRLGFAFGGGPPNGRSVTYTDATSHQVASVVDEGTKFMPLHVEARVRYWFGQNALSRRLRPYVHLGGGMAEVDAKTEIPVRDCGPPGAATTQACVDRSSTINLNALPQANLDAWKKYGLQFVTAGGGAYYGFTDRYGVELNLNLMLMLPSSGLIMEPSLGVVAGF